LRELLEKVNKLNLGNGARNGRINSAVKEKVKLKDKKIKSLYIVLR